MAETTKSTAKTTPAASTEAEQDGTTTIDPAKRGTKTVDTAPTAVADGEAALVQATDESGLDGLYEAVEGDALVVLKQDVLEEFVYPGTKRPSYKLAFHKGQVVRKSELDARVAEIRAANADRTKLENVIDSSTFASGTGLGAAIAQEQSPSGTTETK